MYNLFVFGFNGLRPRDKKMTHL